MQYTTNYQLKKPDGSDVVNIQDLNDNVDKIDGELAKRVLKTDVSDVVRQGEFVKVQQGVESHLADLASQVAGKGANIVGVPAITGLTPGDNLYNVLKNLFQSVDSGKSNVYSAIVGKGTTPANKDFSSLVAGINAINTGKRFLSGSFTTESLATYVKSNLITLNLGFIPNFLYVYGTWYTYKNDFIIYGNRVFFKGGADSYNNVILPYSSSVPGDPDTGKWRNGLRFYDATGKLYSDTGFSITGSTSLSFRLATEGYLASAPINVQWFASE